MKDILVLFGLLLDKEGEDGGAGGAPQDPPKDPEPPQDPEPSGDFPKTQAELDAIVEKRLARDRKDREDAAAEQAKKDAMSETERLKAEKEAAEQKAQTAETAAQQRILTSEARSIALESGVSKEAAPYLLKAVQDQLAKVTFKDGEPVESELKTVIDTALKAMPGFTQAKKQDLGGGSNPGTSTVPQDLDKAAKGGDITAINAAFDALLK